MTRVKKSFISNILGSDTYDWLNDHAIIIVPIGACLLALFIGLSFFFHSCIINWFLQLLTGTSLLFMAYIAVLVVFLDIQVSVNEPESDIWEEPEEPHHSSAYRLTIVWGVFLIILGIGAIYASNKYRKRYAFECDTFLVDHKKGIYHTELYDDCESAIEANELDEMYGYEISATYTLCESCKGFLEEMESFESDRYIRRP